MKYVPCRKNVKIQREFSLFSYGTDYGFIDMGTSHPVHNKVYSCILINKKVQVGKNQEKAQSEKDSHSKNRGGKKPN